MLQPHPEHPSFSRIRMLSLAIGLCLVAAACSATEACTLELGVAVRVRAFDAQSGAPIGNVGVTGTFGGTFALDAGNTSGFPDSTTTVVFGSAGVYDLVVSKTGYLPEARRVIVDEQDSRCHKPILAEIVVSMTRAP